MKSQWRTDSIPGNRRPTEPTPRPPTAGPAAISPLVTDQATADAPAESSHRPLESAWPVGRAGLDDPLLAALVTLTEILQLPSSAEALTAGLPMTDGRLTPALALRAANRAGLSARLVPRPIEQITPLTMPCILLLHDRQACILAARPAADRVTVLLPETGRGVQDLALADLAGRYTGMALFVRAELQLDRRGETDDHRHESAWFWGPLAQAWPVYAEVVVAAILINLFALASPLFVMNVYDRVVPNAAIETLWALAIGALIVFLFDFLLRTLRGYFVDSAGKVADIKIAARIFEQVLGIRMAARPGSAGAFANNLREFESLRDFFTSATLVALVDLPFVLFFVAVVWLIGGPVALVPAIAIPLVLGVGLVLQAPLHRVVKRTFQESAHKHGLLVETINGLETLKCMGAEGRTQRLWERYVGATAASGLQARFLGSLGLNLAALAQNLTTVGVVGVGVYRIADGLMSVGALVACTIIASRAMAPLGQVAGILSRLHQARAAFEALDALMRQPVERPAQRRFLHRPKLAGAIEFKGVRFAYPGEKTPVLDQLAFKIAAGERVGLIGRIGSGKSTVEKLLLGLYQPDQGAILLDGTDLRQIDPADLRRNIGAMLQDVVLFHGTIRDNIGLGAPFADDAAMLQAARIAGVEEFVAQHPRGFDLPVGERGEALSGGQRQAVALARALLLDPPIVILDEPTSAMDHGAEHRFKQRLAAVLDGKTLLLVTHRTSLLSLVDRVIVLDAGKIAADGPKDEVLRALAAGQIKAQS